MRLEPAIELIEHDPRLDRAAFSRDVELDHVIEIFRAIDDQEKS